MITTNASGGARTGDDTSVRALLSRALAGNAALGLLGTLGLPWVQVSDSQHYTGAALLLAGFGNQTPYVCGVTDCTRIERFLAGGLPAWIVVASAIALLAVLTGTGVAGRRVTTVLLSVAIAGQISLLIWQGRAATDPNTAAAGVLIVIVMAVVGLVATSSPSRSSRLPRD